MELRLFVPDITVQGAPRSDRRVTDHDLAIVLGHPNVVSVAKTDVVKDSIPENEARLEDITGGVIACDVTCIVNSAAGRSVCPRVVNLRELSIAQQESMFITISRLDP